MSSPAPAFSLAGPLRSLRSPRRARGATCSTEPPCGAGAPPDAEAASGASSRASLALADLLPGDGVSVLDARGEPVDLAGALLAPPGDVVVAAWLRHYGCTLCARLAAEWQRDLVPRVVDRDGKSARLVLVGCGTPEQAEVFRGDVGWTGEIYSDPERKTYKALDFAQGIGSLIQGDAFFTTLKSFRDGHRQRWGMKATDPLQQGGVLVIDRREERVALLHKERYAGDHLPVGDIADAVESLFVPASVA